MSNNNNNANSSIKVEIVTPENSFRYEGVYMVVMPGSEGEFGVLQGHVPLIAALDAGAVTIYDKNMKITDLISISDGFVEVTANSSVLILVEQASLMN